MKEHPLNGDMNWIIPGKILGFAGPTEEVYTVEEFADFAVRNNIKTVVRLNRVHYDAKVLAAKGVDHHEMFMHDGGIPSLQQIDEFYILAEAAWKSGAMAVHCRAGLGRTGTMIATFLIKKFKLQAAEVIAYLRMMRPGSVLGMQARFLDSIQYMLRGEETPIEAQPFLNGYYPDHFHTFTVSSDTDSRESENENEKGLKVCISGTVRAK
ncbi:hypothetical protein PSACC_02463 [Paramicrosporidium saccamoebae]|uniref:protein-tyrosine-phosphatase n=1 Tax=Paramicrosporidium saccamoebae TaxID=1246581 RepID=A0A2H9TIY3_9FUNG|nr:hypothetical protein PSACC_02463 [Paramicrosporidium saccamoebae]